MLNSMAQEAGIELTSVNWGDIESLQEFKASVEEAFIQ